MSYNGLPPSEFNLPPGVSSRDIDEAFGPPKEIECENCGRDIPYDENNPDQETLCKRCLEKAEEQE